MKGPLMEKTPRISIGLPVYNAEKYLRHALDGILSQTFTDFELIICDNASTDSTARICASYAASDSRVRFYRNDRNLGAAENFNKVFRLARADYFKWIAYDDICMPTFLDKCLAVLERHPEVALCYPKTMLIDAEGSEIMKYEDRLHMMHAAPHDRLRHFLTKVNLANAVFGVIRTSVLRQTGLLGKYFGADYILLMEICLRGKFFEIPEHLFLRRDHERWDSSRKTVYKYIQSRLVSEQFLAINRSGLGWYEKGLCFAQIGRWILRQWRAKGGRYKANLKGKVSVPKPQKNSVY
jgi:glycosyltransferase involved in cell wall biosynthesis